MPAAARAASPPGSRPPSPSPISTPPAVVAARSRPTSTAGARSSTGLASAARPPSISSPAWRTSARIFPPSAAGSAYPPAACPIATAASSFTTRPTTNAPPATSSPPTPRTAPILSRPASGSGCTAVRFGAPGTGLESFGQRFFVAKSCGSFPLAASHVRTPASFRAHRSHSRR